MTTDLFKKPKSMRARVMDYCKLKHFINTIDLENLKDTIKQDEGIIKGLLRIQREARQLANDGIFRRLSDFEKKSRGFPVRFAAYEWVGEAV